METTPPPLPPRPVKAMRRNATTFKLLLIAALVLLLQAPLHLVGMLQQERLTNILNGRRAWAESTTTEAERAAADVAKVTSEKLESPAFEPYRIVVRALKFNILVIVLVFAAFFLFETLCRLRLHAIHYGLVGAALCLFYLALLALGEVVRPGLAYLGAAGASSVLITLYSSAILRSQARAAVILGLLACVHSVLYVVLQLQNFALLAGTATLFAALAAVMYFTRNIDWNGRDEGKEVAA